MRPRPIRENRRLKQEEEEEDSKKKKKKEAELTKFSFAPSHSLDRNLFCKIKL
jgi:hypothetical protein